MRELTEAELDLISGGYDSGEDIVVTGSPYPPPYYPPPYYPPPYYPPPPPYGGGGGGAYDDFPTDWQGLSTTGESNAPYVGLPHMEPGTSRSLTQSEKIAVAGYTNLSDAQLSAVRINSGGLVGPGAVATTLPWGINFASDFALTDFSTNADTMDLLVHELTHTYQYESGLGYARMAADEAVANTSSHNYYTYSQADLQQSVQNPSNFQALNIETQAAIVQDLYRLSNGLPAQGATGFTPTAADLAAASHLPR